MIPRHRKWRLGRAALLVVLTGLLPACNGDDFLPTAVFEQPETQVAYEITLTGMPEEEMVELAEQSLGLYQRQEDGAASVAFLRRRAEADIETLGKLLRSRGYYKGRASVKVTEPEGTEKALVTILVEPGPAFTLTRHGFVLVEPTGVQLPDPATVGSPVGGQALAAAIVASEVGTVELLRQGGYPYAESAGRSAEADLEAATLEVDSRFASGPSAVFGPIVFEGLEDVRSRYLLTYVPWSEGDTFDITKLRAYQKALLGTDLFAAITVTPPAEAPEGAGPEVLPVTVRAEERPFRTVSAGLRYSTDDGPVVTAGFEHRNIWGENETLTVEGEAGIDLQQVGIGYREPQYMRPGQDLLASLTLRREIDDAFDDLTVTATAGLQRRVSRRWVLGAGGLVEASLIEDNGVESTVFLGGLPLTATYDRTDDLLDPSKGERLNASVTPFVGTFDGDFASFLTLDATGSVYYDLTGSRDYILAGRGRFASILTDELATVPQTRRLYSGGPAVRGYSQRMIGPLDVFNDPIGGLSAVELGLEARARIWGDLGGVVFAEAGSVGVESWPDFNEGVQVAAGFGFRYFSPAGPIRVDIAFPLNGRDADDAWQLYFSIGQAF